MINVTTDARRNNCFNLIRLIGALQVFFGHACEHLEVKMPMAIRLLWGCFRGVPIFFILSGFLLWMSLERNGNFKQYCKKRVLRLYPELWGGVLVNAIVMIVVYGASIVVIPFLAHIVCQGTILQFWTPSSLRGYGCGAPNGSLWTIGVMVQSYVVFYFVWKLLHKRSIKWKAVALAMAAACNFLPHLANRFLPGTIAKLFSQTFIPYFWMFLFGGLMAAYFDKIIGFLKEVWPILFLISATISIFGLEEGIGAYELLKSITFGLAMVGFAYQFSKLEMKRDYSYGFYIYHMIVINLMLHLNFTGKIVYIAVALMLSVLLAIASQWTIKWIEKKIKRKNQGVATIQAGGN